MMRINGWLSLAVLAAGLLTSSFSYAEYTRVEENSASVSYSGTWTTYRDARVSGGSVVASRQPGARATLTFDGTGIRWISYGCQCAPGPAHIYLDGVLQATTAPVPGWADTEPKLQKFAISGLVSGTHTLTIEVADNLPGYAGPTLGTVVVDAFLVETRAMTLLQENDPSITYSGNWTDIDDPSVSGGSVLATNQVGATATIRFSGTGVSWFGYRCPCTGRARTRLDSFNPLERDTYAPQRQAQALIQHFSGLTNAEHQLTIEALGSSSGGPWLVIDAFGVFAPDAPDTMPPEVTIRAPAQDDTVYGNVEIVADAFDGQAPNDVFFMTLGFYVDGVQIQPTRFGVSPYARYMWDTTAHSDGQHVITVVARDSAGNETRSAPITITVDNATDRAGPQVNMTSPASNSQVTGIVTLAADATDRSGVTRVEFYYAAGGSNEILIGTDTTAPYAITRDTSGIPSGRSFVLFARAYDTAGNVERSPPITVTVQH